MQAVPITALSDASIWSRKIPENNYTGLCCNRSYLDQSSRDQPRCPNHQLGPGQRGTPADRKWVHGTQRHIRSPPPCWRPRASRTCDRHGPPLLSVANTARGRCTQMGRTCVGTRFLRSRRNTHIRRSGGCSAPYWNIQPLGAHRWQLQNRRPKTHPEDTRAASNQFPSTQGPRLGRCRTGSLGSRDKGHGQSTGSRTARRGGCASHPTQSDSAPRE